VIPIGTKKKAVAAGAAAKAAKDNAYLQRLIHDDDLQDNIRQAYESARDAYNRLDGKKATSQIFDDKKLQKDLKQAAESIKEATVALREAPDQKSGGGFMRKVLLLTIAGGLALALSEGLRKKVLDALFGAEEEFEYTSTTAGGTNSNSGSSTTASATTGSTAASNN
jgi:adenylosuccinate synthase